MADIELATLAEGLYLSKCMRSVEELPGTRFRWLQTAVVNRGVAARPDHQRHSRHVRGSDLAYLAGLATVDCQVGTHGPSMGSGLVFVRYVVRRDCGLPPCPSCPCPCERRSLALEHLTKGDFLALVSR